MHAEIYSLLSASNQCHKPHILWQIQRQITAPTFQIIGRILVAKIHRLSKTVALTYL